MGKRGPKPTPTNILKLRGSWRGKTRPTEPQPPRDKPACPAWLAKTDRPLWRRLTAQLAEMGVLTKLDQHALGRYLVLFQRWQKMEAFITQYGESYPLKNKKGEVIGFRLFVQVKLAQDLADQLLKLEQHFGMTPSARASLGTQGLSEPPLTDEAMAKRRLFSTG